MNAQSNNWRERESPLSRLCGCVILGISHLTQTGDVILYESLDSAILDVLRRRQNAKKHVEMHNENFNAITCLSLLWNDGNPTSKSLSTDPLRVIDEDKIRGRNEPGKAVTR